MTRCLENKDTLQTNVSADQVFIFQQILYTEVKQCPAMLQI